MLYGYRYDFVEYVELDFSIVLVIRQFYKENLYFVFKGVYEVDLYIVNYDIRLLLVLWKYREGNNFV